MCASFHDEVVIRIKAGKGGAGAVSFHREKFKRVGPPDGGDGGDGGSIFFLSDANLSNLNHFDTRRTYAAEDGDPGSRNHRHGAKGKDLEIRVPVGTVIEDTADDTLLRSFDSHGQSYLAGKGGMGGKGNAFFKSPTRRSPRFSQKGRMGVEREVRLKLKLIADIGLVGFPNAGKSTLLAAVTNAHPKIADYSFTTLTPNLGILEMDEKRFSVADIPGLVENAHKGVGLGLSFLKHIEKTRAMIYVVDGTGKDLEESYRILRNELDSYQAGLSAKPHCIAINKCDLLAKDGETAALGLTGVKVVLISALKGTGLDDLKRTIRELLG